MSKRPSRDEVRALLETERPWTIYALGDLAPGFFEHAEWLVPTDGSAALALVLRLPALGTPVLFTLGASEGVRPLLGVIGDPRMYLSVRPEILTLLRERYAILDERAMWRLILDPARFAPEIGEGTARLGPDDLEALRRLYADGEESGESPGFFYPYMLEEGLFHGIRESDELVAAAGIHVASPSEGVAGIGNVYTRRDRRGRRLAGRAIAGVVNELQRIGVRTIGLNVSQTNTAAIRTYERLGFERYCEFYEGIAILTTTD